LLIEPLPRRPFSRRAEAYQLLVTFGRLLILEDAVRFIWGGTPLTADALIDAVPIIHVGDLVYPGYNLVVVGIGALAALVLWVVIYPMRRPSRSAASWRGSPAPSWCRARPRCSGWG
jgi:branched-chain amino acid transport system permease protein